MYFNYCLIANTKKVLPMKTLFTQFKKNIVFDCELDDQPAPLACPLTSFFSEDFHQFGKFDEDR